MHLSALEEYGLRCVLQLARVKEGEQVPASRIAEGEGISLEYVSKLMYLFRKSGLVKATRGVQGGFYLSRPASTISLKEVMDSLKGKRQSHPDFCKQFVGHQDKCTHFSECSIRPVWLVLVSYFEETLREITLEDLLSPEKDMQQKVLMVAEEKSRKLKDYFKSQSFSEVPVLSEGASHGA